MFAFLKKKKSSEVTVQGNRRRVQPINTDLDNTLSQSAAESGTPGRAKLKGAARFAMQFLAATLLTALTVLAGIGAYRHATTSDYFKFSELDVSGNYRLTNEEVLLAAGLTLGENIFATDVMKAEAALRQNAWIETAEVIRRLPGKVIIRVTERKARALVNLDVLYLVDDMGRVFKRWVRGDPVPSPVITGISREEYIQSPAQIESVLCDALDLADRYAGLGLDRAVPMQEIYREPDLGFSMTVGEDPIYVKFGKGPYKKKLDRLSQLLRKMSADNQRPGQIFFDNEIRPDRITVKMKGETSSDTRDVTEVQSNETKKIVSKI